MPIELVFARQERPAGLSTLEQVQALRDEARDAAATAATDAVAEALPVLDGKITAAGQAQASAETAANQAAAAASSLQFTSRAEAMAAAIPVPVRRIAVATAAGLLEFVRDPAGTAMETAGGARWSPLPPYQLSHWTEVRGSTGSVSVQFQAAVDWIGENGGGDLHLGKGVIPISQTVYWGDTTYPVLIRGLGRGVISNNVTATRQSATTRVVWTGATGGNGLILTADRNDTGLKPRASGGGLIDVMLDGRSVGGRGLQVISHNEHVIRVHLAWWADVMFFSSVLVNGVSNAPADTQRFDWDIATSDLNSTAESKAHFVAHGRGGANTSRGIIRSLSLSTEREAVAAHFGDFDGTVIHNLGASRRQATGGGGQVILHGAATFPADIAPAGGSCRHVAITMSQVRQFVAKDGSGPNHVMSLSRGNGAAAPAYEGTGVLYWEDSFGAIHASSIAGAAVQSGARDATAGRLLKLDKTQGSFGLGSTIPPTCPDLDDNTLPVGVYRTAGASTLGTYPAGVSNFGTLVILRYDEAAASQEYRPVNANRSFRRAYFSAAWSPWVEQ